LEKKQFVEFRPDPADRRCKRIYVLEKGWEHIEQIHRVIKDNEDRIVDGFSEEEKQQCEKYEHDTFYL
jgi:DNA-binding MarR family transcriptional regulator